MKIDYSVIVPVYRGEKSINELFLKVKTFFESINKSFEMIFVYDCGPDNSWQVIQNMQKRYPAHIKAIHLTRNFGQHNALICGFKYCKGVYIVTMDEDLQHSPDDINALISQQQEKDYDVVYGITNEPKHSFFRNITSNTLKLLLRSGIPGLHNNYSAFRIIKSEVARQTISMNNAYTFLDGYLTWVTNSVSSVKVSHFESKAGRSSYTIGKLIRHSINIFITFSSLPTRIVTLSSFLFFFISVFYTGYIIFRKLFYNDLIPGFATIAIISGFGFGIVLFCLGIIAEYLQRINMRTTNRPPYLEKEIISQSRED